MIAAIVWNVNPEIFRIGNFAPRWYGVLFALSFYVGYLILTGAFNKEGVPIKVLDSLVLYIGVAVLIGARLGHCLLYEPGYYLQHPLEMLKIWQGGLASHGAAIGILIAIYIFPGAIRNRICGLWTALSLSRPWPDFLSAWGIF